MTKTVQNNHTDVYLNSFDSKNKIAGSVVLDAGCGDGYASKCFIDAGAQAVYSVDPYTPMLDNGRPIWLSEESSFFTRNWQDIDNLNLKFDIVWHHHVIEHVEDVFSFLRKLHGLLTDDGEMWLACPNMAQHSIFSPGHIHNFQSAQLIEVLRLCGFAVANSSIWVKEGQLRIRVPKTGDTAYPTPMKDSITQTGRCPSELLTYWNWK
jgi:2-polyprenyl-3-methyl-5-hydroxy-6-metoxy-1,4-benzoquinol methylase